MVLPLAFVDASNKVIQFLSYEGVLQQLMTRNWDNSTDIELLKLALKRWELASINWPRNKIQRFHLDSSSKHF
jgi:hypothetical protein